MYELIKNIFLRNGTVRTNKMKFWRSKKRGQKHAKIAKEGRISAVIFLRAHPASFTHNIVFAMQSFYFSESQDAMVL